VKTALIIIQQSSTLAQISPNLTHPESRITCPDKKIYSAAVA